MARRDQVAAALTSCVTIRCYYLLLRVRDATDCGEKCHACGIILRNQSHQLGLESLCSIGSDEDMQAFISVVRGEVVSGRDDQRVETVIRKTNETAISVRVNLDAASPVRINTGIGFYDHMWIKLPNMVGFSRA